jgi:hypothetical protein
MPAAARHVDSGPELAPCVYGGCWCRRALGPVQISFGRPTTLQPPVSSWAAPSFEKAPSSFFVMLMQWRTPECSSRLMQCTGCGGGATPGAWPLPCYHTRSAPTHPEAGTSAMQFLLPHPRCQTMLCFYAQHLLWMKTISVTACAHQMGRALAAPAALSGGPGPGAQLWAALAAPAAPVHACQRTVLVICASGQWPAGRRARPVRSPPRPCALTTGRAPQGSAAQPGSLGCPGAALAGWAGRSGAALAGWAWQGSPAWG